MRHIWWLLVPAMLCLAVPAQARPRDDALSGAIRCGVVSDSRQWLDCYYGAAQPVRAALGMGSALPAQIALAASPPSGGQPRDEAVRDEVVAEAAGCARVTGDGPWLDCYYAAAMPMRVQLGLLAPQAVPRPAQVAPPQQAVAPSRPMAPAKPAGPPPMPRSNTGLFSGIFRDTKPIVRDMPMQSFVLDNKGAFTVTLEDGEEWEQSPEDEIRHTARWRRAAADMLVTISPDTMHTFILIVAGENFWYKVHRIR